MDFIVTSVLVFATGLLVGRLFYKLNPFLMIIGLVLGGSMFVMAMELNILYCLVMIVGIYYGLSIMRSRNADVSQMGDSQDSLFQKLAEFVRLRLLQSDAEKFRQQQAEENSAYDEYKRYEEKAYQSQQQTQEQADQQTQQAQQEAEKAQADAERAKQQYQQEKQKYEQEKQKAQQQSGQEEFVDTRSSYEILGVKETASLDEIKKAYRKLRAKLHADKNQNRSPAYIKEAEKELIKVIHAYESLTGKKT